MLKMKVIKRENNNSNDPSPQRLDSSGSARGSFYGGFGMGRSFNGSVRGDSAARQIRSGSSQRSALDELLKVNHQSSRVQSPKGLPEIKTPRNNKNDASYHNEIQKVLPQPNKAELRRNLAGHSFDISATVAAPNTLGGLGSPRTNGFLPNSSPNNNRGGEDIFSH